MNLHKPLFASEEDGRPSTPVPQVAQLRQEIERLLIITESLWVLLQEKLGVEEADLVREMVKIDMRDGRLDGRVAASGPAHCPACQRALFKHRPRCLYCGELVPPRPFDR